MRHGLTSTALARRVAAEFAGTAFLLIAVVGSGIAAARLSPNDVGMELLENALATGAALVAIILALGPVSGAHLNPVITLVDRTLGGIGTTEAFGYMAGQLAGGVAGTVLANLMFSRPMIELSKTVRGGSGRWLGEVVATTGLVLVVFGLARSGRATAAPFAVGAYIGGAYFFTSSTSFANPAVSLARIFSNTFAGIAPRSVLAFVTAQLVGGALAAALVRFLYPDVHEAARQVTVPHEEGGS